MLCRSIHALILSLALLSVACGGNDPVEDEVPVEPVPEPPSAEELAAAEQEMPLGGCEPGVETTQGFLLRCPGYNLLVGRWVKADALALVDQAKEGISLKQEDEPVNFGPSFLEVGQTRWSAFVYAIGRTGKQRGYVVAVGDRRDQARLMHCMAEQEDAVERCKRGVTEVAMLGEIPTHLVPESRRRPAEGAQTLVPRLHERALLVPKGCKAQGHQIACEDGAMLIWKEIASTEVEQFEQSYTAQLKAALSQRMQITKEIEQSCVVDKQKRQCQLFMTKDEALGAGRVVVAPLRASGQRAVLVCVDQSKRPKGALPQVCAQLLSWR